MQSKSGSHKKHEMIVRFPQSFRWELFGLTPRKKYLFHITIEKWSQICTRTMKKGFFEDILFMGLFPIEIPIVNLIPNLEHD
mgnify:CR=1 FL=1